MRQLKQRISAFLLLVAFCATTAVAMTNPSHRHPLQKCDSTISKLMRSPMKMEGLRLRRNVPLSREEGPRKFLASSVGAYASMCQVELSVPPVYSSIVEGNGIHADGGAALVGDIYYCVEQLAGSILTISAFNALTWEQISSTVVYGWDYFAHDMTYDPVDKKIYGCFMKTDGEGNTDGFVWGWLDVDNLNRVAIADMDKSMAAVAATPEGVIYALDYDGVLYTVSKTDGALTYVADTGLVSELATGGVIDPKTGVMYYITQTNADIPVIYSIDVETGESQSLGTLDGWQQLRGMFFPAPLASDNAPEAISDIDIQFNRDALTGKAVIKMPDKTYGGEDMSGQLEYMVYVNGEQYGSGKAYSGDTQSVTLEFHEVGMYTIGVTVSNEHGSSPVYEETHWIGLDELAPLGFVTMTEENGNVQLSWPEATSMHGGWFDRELVTYDVTRLPDEVVIATDITANQCADVIEKGELLQANKWRVDVKYDGKTVSSSTSNAVISGTETEVPFRTSFDTADDFSFFTVIDGNDDGEKWEYMTFFDINQCAGLKSHDTNSGNDYLITPGIRMKGGKKYKFSFTPASYLPWCPERIEVLYGTAPTVEALTHTLVEPMIVDKAKDDADKVSVIFEPASDDVYYFAFHGISDPYEFYLIVDDISVTNSDGKAPGAVTDLKAIAGEAGASSAYVSFRTPTLNENGGELDALNSVVLKRDGQTLNIWNNPAPGTMLEYEDVDESLAGASHTYTILSENGSGESAPASIKVYIGEDMPGKVENLKAIQNPDGTVTVTWDRPATGVNGGYINPDDMTYTVSRHFYESGRVVTITTTSETSCMDNFTSDSQTLLSYTVLPSNSVGTGNWTDTESMILGGTPFTIPFVESAPDGYPWNTMWSAEYLNTQGSWYTAQYGVAPKCSPQDEDGGMYEFVAEAVGDRSRLASGNIDASTMSHPVLTFWYYAAGDNTLSVEVNPDNSGWQRLGTIRLSDAGSEGWTHARFYLSGIQLSRTLRLGFVGESADLEKNIYIDNIILSEAPSKNLGITSAVFTDEVATGFDVTADLRIENTGIESISDAKVGLYRNSDLVAEYDIPTLKTGESVEIHAVDPVNQAFPSHIEYSAVLMLDGDTDESDNRKTCIVNILHNYDLPVPRELSSKVDDNMVTIKWNAPSEYIGSYEDFESYEPFGSFEQIGPWKSIDGNGTGKITPVDGDVPIDIPTAGLPVGFQIFDSREIGMTSHDLDGHDSAKAIVAFADKSGVNNDWLISPLIKGGSDVTFYVKGGSPYFTEKFTVLYSSTDREQGSFVVIGDTRTTSGDWTKVEIKLPEDAMYFAICYCSFDCYALMIDDISYETQAGKAILRGYNVYRDNKFLATTGANETMHTSGLDTGHTYAVTALYDQGESQMSEPLPVKPDGIDDVTTDADIRVTIAKDAILVTGAEGLNAEVYSADGKMVTLRRCGTEERISLVPGIYVVRIGTCFWKIRI